MRLKTKTVERWVKLDDSGAEVLLRPLTMTEGDRIREAHTRRKVKRGVEVERVNAKAMAQELYSSVIRDWRGMKDETGSDLPFSDENLRAVIDSDSDFLALIDEKIEDLNAEIKASGKALEKN